MNARPHRGCLLVVFLTRGPIGVVYLSFLTRSPIRVVYFLEVMFILLAASRDQKKSISIYFGFALSVIFRIQKIVGYGHFIISIVYIIHYTRVFVSYPQNGYLIHFHGCVRSPCDCDCYVCNSHVTVICCTYRSYESIFQTTKTTNDYCVCYHTKM